jgi:hypothetical protein
MIAFEESQMRELLPKGFLLVPGVIVCLLLLLTRFGVALYCRIERVFSNFAEKPVLAAVVLFLAVIATRLLALPLLPVPVPVIPDEFSYLLQADTFAHGRLANPPHPMWVSLETFHVNWLPTYSSKFPPAQGFALAIGQLFGHAWIGVLLSDAAMCVSIFWMLLAWVPRRWAFCGAAIAALKFGLTSYWGGAVAAIGGALVLGGLARIAKRARQRDAVLLGFGVAILANSRPYEGLFFCLPAAVWFVLWLAGKIKTKDSFQARIRKGLVPLTGVLILSAAFMGYYDWRLTGKALLMPYQLNTRTYYTGPFFLWEHAKPKLSYNNEPFEAFYNGWVHAEYHTTRTDALKVSKEKTKRYLTTFFWPGAQLLLPALPFIFADRRMRLLLLTFGVGMLANFAVVWSNSHYAAPLTCVIYALLVQMVRHVRTMRVSTVPFGIALTRAALVLLLFSTATHTIYGVCDPLRFPCARTSDRALIVEKLNHLNGKHLVLVRYTRLHDPTDEWVSNDADIDGAKVVWARELDREQNAKLFAYFKGRHIWLVNPDVPNGYLEPYPLSTNSRDEVDVSGM